MFKLGKASLAHLSECKPEIQEIVRHAITICEVDFSVVDGRRTIDEQREYVATGKSWTMDSRHLPDPADGLSFAVDIYPYYAGGTDHSVELYRKIAKAMFKSAILHGVDLEWGGLWSNPDSPHWQLSREKYRMPL